MKLLTKFHIMTPILRFNDVMSLLLKLPLLCLGYPQLTQSVEIYKRANALEAL